MFAGMGHDAIIRGYHQQEDIYSGCSRHHVLDETFVTGRVHHTERATTRQPQLSITQFYRYAPLLLLLQPVGIFPGPGLYERSLPVVDVACGAEGESSLRHPFSPEEESDDTVATVSSDSSSGEKG